MSESAGEKTEAPSTKKLEEAQQRGQFPKSAEVQTVFVMLGGLCGLMSAGPELWNYLAQSLASTMGHIHDTPVSATALQGYAALGLLGLGKCLWPVLGGTVLGGLLAGAIQSRFTTCPEALTINFERLNPVEGFKRIFSMRSAMPTGIALFKLAFISLLTWSTVKEVLGDPILTQAVDLARLGSFLAESTLKIALRILMLLGVVAAADYSYQCWRSYKDMMMTKEEVKEEAKGSEGNPQVKSAQRRKRRKSKRKMLEEVAFADVVVTNPTHIAIALKYDRKTMQAPKILAKGIRLNAQQIREIAQQHQVPIVENKPLARLMFKYGKVGGEIPAQLFAAVAEVLAWVYRNNRYRYYAEANRA
ncbi:MAG: EscU/YscU/HrcU family type III secretion system export apparatus switch protein [Verrucomicrobiota bacterium]